MAGNVSHARPGPNRPNSTVNGWLVAVLLVLVAVLLFQMTGGLSKLLHDPGALPRPVTARGDLSADEKSQIELFRMASPSVVHITSVALRRDRLSLNVFEIPSGSGSGFVWDKQGYIVTNFHVVQEAFQQGDAGRVRVTLTDNSTWEARQVGAEPDKDLAVLKIDAPPARLIPILIGTSADLQVGQKVFAIGNPFNLDQTLTTGVISGVGRDIQSVTRRSIHGVIQTDAAINPGNSGGPLLDSAGRLIGINTAIYSPSGAYSGIGFAVPVDTVNRTVPQLIRYGKIERPALGIHIFDDTVVEQLRRANVLKEQGVLVRDVLPNSAAEKAGLVPTRRDSLGEIRLGDLIVKINETRIKTSNDLFDELDRHKVGDTVTLTVLRDGQRLELPITFQTLPSMNP